MFIETGEKYNKPHFKEFKIMASNEIHEESLYDLAKAGHEIDSFGIGTNLITCLKQPALGMVYKLVSINGVPRLKLSEDIDKVTLPGSKSIYRIYVKDKLKPAFDLICLRSEAPPKEGQELKVMDSTKPIVFTPVNVELLNPLVFDGKTIIPPVTIKEGQKEIYSQLDNFNPAIFQREKPEKYPVLLSVEMFNLVEAMMKEAKGQK